MSLTGPAAQQQYGHHYAHQSAAMGGAYASSSVSAQMAASPGFVYSPSALPGYDAYPPSSSSSSYSQYVSYLPPAMPSAHDSRFYPLNPFEIKHRRRTTKTQFRVLESTFHEVPKPNATLRKQISAQLDMPVRAVQIWFQNRRAKAKAMEKKKLTGAAEVEQGRAASGLVGAAVAHHAYSAEAGERYGGVSHAEDAMRGGGGAGAHSTNTLEGLRGG